MKFSSSLIVVNDIERSRKFYEAILEQEVEFDFGENVSFKNGFSIHLKRHYANLLQLSEEQILSKSNNFELYFDEENFDNFLVKLSKATNIVYIHKDIEQPWGQRAIRFYDPDMHIIEVGETMASVIKRFYKNGMTVNDISNKTGLSPDFINKYKTS